jgi:hypothetical protein
VMCGRDIVELLKRHGHATPAAVSAWLGSKFPKESRKGPS